MTDEAIESILAEHDISLIESKSVSGGDINKSYQLQTNKGLLFLKINEAKRFPLMLKKEAEGLNALKNVSRFKIPEVIAIGELDDQQYLLMEWLEKSAPSNNFWEQFAQALAQLHQNTSDNFGWASSNYIGSLPQLNNPSTSWATFYGYQRIMPLVTQLFNNKLFTKTDLDLAEGLCKKMNDIFPDEPPSLLHGDLWAGNFMAVKPIDGLVVPSIFDPAVYYGHREMDIGMSLLFGGFDNSMYSLYNDIFPLEKEWRQRVSLTQLFPLLVHAILFGGGYIERSKSILRDWK